MFLVRESSDYNFRHACFVSSLRKTECVIYIHLKLMDIRMDLFVCLNVLTISGTDTIVCVFRVTISGPSAREQ